MRLLLTGAWGEARQHVPELEAMGHEIAFMPQEKDPLPIDPAWPEGVICNGLFLYHPIAAFTALRLIQLTAAGFDRVDLEAARARDIRVCNARGVYSRPMAEFALCGVLELYKQSAFFRAGQQARRWEKRRDLRELGGKRVLILGCGSVGRTCAQIFGALGCQIFGVDLAPMALPEFEQILSIQAPSALDEQLSCADVVLVTLPLTPETRGLLDAARLGLLRRDAVLVNLSRGPVVDELALIRALQTGALGGAVLDVFEREPLDPASPLWALPNVILTPHNSFVGEGNAQRLWAVIRQNLAQQP